MENDSVLDLNHTPEGEYKLAGFWIRVGASVLDSLILIPIIALNMYVLYFVKDFYIYAFVALLSFAYKPIMEGVWGATLGKMICKLKVTDINFQQVKMSKAFVRSLFWLFASLAGLLEIYPLFSSEAFIAADGWLDIAAVQSQEVSAGLSYVFQLLMLVSALFVASKARQGLHDKMAGTYCVFVERKID